MIQESRSSNLKSIRDILENCSTKIIDVNGNPIIPENLYDKDLDKLYHFLYSLTKEACLNKTVVVRGGIKGTPVNKANYLLFVGVRGGKI